MSARARSGVARRRRRSGGFTLVELMVAVTGGLFVSIAVFVLAKHSTGFYQAEARVGNATFGGLIGFNRLKADIARAGFLASPNVRRDPAICGNVTTWPEGLASLASIRIETGTAPTVLASNGRSPDTLTLAGSYVSNDQFETAAIYVGGGGHEVYLRPNSPGLARLGYLETGANQLALLQTVFQAGRALRVVDKTGREQYGTITSVTAGSQPKVTVALDKPAFQYRDDGNTGFCGFNDHGVGSLANVVNVVRYSIQEADTLATTRYDRAVRPTKAAATDEGRTELVRSELNTDGDPIENSEEIVAELAVDMKFGITVATTFGTNPNGTIDQTRVATLLPGDPAIEANWAGDVTTLSVGQGPQLIRSVRARFSVRSREADRTGNVQVGGDGGVSNVAPGFYRIRLPGGGDTSFARVRTLQADVALRNQMEVMWQ